MDTRTSLRLATIDEARAVGVHPVAIVVTGANTAVPPLDVIDLSVRFADSADVDTFANAHGLPADDGLMADYDRHGVTSWAGYTVSMRVTSPRPVVHGCPPDGSGLTPCCRRTPFELDSRSRITSDATLVTCGR